MLCGAFFMFERNPTSLIILTRQLYLRFVLAGQCFSGSEGKVMEWGKGIVQM
jgi:hypothetical protein